MLRTFDLDDDDLVLIIGSGAGGGTLGNELAQKGIRTVILVRRLFLPVLGS
jgi:2-polyprenyl-6-methoxyphenol hydroxylase-like FAD-dependent oxidoreductase